MYHGVPADACSSLNKKAAKYASGSQKFVARGGLVALHSGVALCRKNGHSLVGATSAGLLMIAFHFS